MIHTLNTQYVNGNGALLEEHYDGEILHLTYVELDGHDHNSWHVLREKISKYVTKYSINLIVMDRAGDPCNLNDTQGGYGPSSLQMLNSLLNICRTIIITDDWTYFYKQNKNVKFVSTNLWHTSQKNIHKYYQFQDTVYDTTIEKTHPLMCLNRNLEWHRIYLLYLLHNKTWFSKVDFSFILPLDIRLEKPFIKKHFTEQEIKVINDIKTPIQLEEEKNKEIYCLYDTGGSSVNIPVFQRNAINLVTETSVDSSIGIIFSEKTAKAIMAYQIPILIANQGANQWLEDVGIDMFADYVPWKEWDEIDNTKQRIHTIACFVDNLMQKPSEIMDSHKGFYNRLKNNKERFHSKEFGNLLIRQLSDPVL